MTLVSCPECDKKVSTRASACPNCGCPIAGSPENNPPAYREPETPSEKSRGKSTLQDLGWPVILTMVLLVALIILAMYFALLCLKQVL